jgi:hypothetical protein
VALQQVSNAQFLSLIDLVEILGVLNYEVAKRQPIWVNVVVFKHPKMVGVNHFEPKNH